MPTTARLALPYPTSAASANVPVDLAALAAALDNLAVWGQGLLSARPAASGTTGRIYYATDTGHFYVNTGTAWVDIGPNIVSPGSITATELASNAVTQAKILDGSVSTSKIAALAVTGALLAAAAVDTTKIAAALKPSGGAGGGTEALRALGIVSGTAAAGNDVRFGLRGRIDSAGNILGGAGFTVSKVATGRYQITFSVAFAAPPAVVVTPMDGGQQFVNILDSSTASVEVQFHGTGGGLNDQGFHFYAMPVS